MFSVLSLLAFLCVCSNVGGGTVRRTNLEEFQLSLIHFNDFHARFQQTSPTSTKCIPEQKACIGGFPRLYTAIKQLREREPDSILLNAGDDFQGTLWYTVLKWDVTQHFMNMLNIDAHALGNHEFDDGIAGVVPYLKTFKSPALVSNIDASEEPSMQGLFQDSLIVERNGVRIGLIGVITSDTKVLASTGKLKFTDEIEAVQRVANDLTSQGVNIIVVISHCGIDVDKKMAAKVGNIDIIVGGHSHTLLYPDNEKPPVGEISLGNYPTIVSDTGNTVLIVQAAAFSKFVGNLKVKFDSNGTIRSWSGKSIYLDSSVPQDEKILEELRPYQDQVDKVANRYLGESAVHLDKSQCYNGDCNIGNFITDSYVEYCVGLAPKGSWTLASVGLINIGGIRTDLNKGNITYEDLLLVHPFSNKIQTFELSGKHLLEVLEHSASDRFRLQVSGLRVVFDMSKKPGRRVVSVKVRCAKCNIPVYEKLNPKTIYSITAPAFLANGGDFYSAIADNKMNAVDHGVDIEIVEAYIAKHSPIYAEIDGRIKYITATNNKYY